MPLNSRPDRRTSPSGQNELAKKPGSCRSFCRSSGASPSSTSITRCVLCRSPPGRNGEPCSRQESKCRSRRIRTEWQWPHTSAERAGGSVSGLTMVSSAPALRCSRRRTGF